MRNQSQADLTITELRVAGRGVLQDGATVFHFTGQDHSAPMGDLALKLNVTTTRKEIPGSNRVVEHAMATSWQPFTISGEWRDMWGNRNTDTGFGRTGPFAWSMVEEFADFVARTPLVRFELDAFRFVCLITSFDIRYQTKAKIGWSMTFSPHFNETMGDTRKVRRTITQPIAKWLQDVGDQGVELNAFYRRAVSLPMKTNVFDDFALKLVEIQGALDRLESIAAGEFTNNTTQRLLLLSTTFRRLRSASLDTALALKRSTSSIEVAFDDALLATTYAEWNFGTQVIAWRLAGFSFNAERDILRKARKKPRAIHRPKRGESLERISARYYGTPNNWRVIYDGNNLSSLVLDGTEELIIPEITA